MIIFNTFLKLRMASCGLVYRQGEESGESAESAFVRQRSCLKVTVQFETERNGQNEIFSHMDRSEVKL